MVTVTSIGNNSEQPSVADFIYNPDQLIAGPFQIVTANGTLKAGTTGQIIARGTVVGAITLGTATSAAKSGGNTGNGTLVMDVTTPVLANAIPGVYTVRNIEAVTNGGKFQVIDPKGVSLGTVIIPAGAGGSVVFSDRIKFAITDGSTDFALGDGFDITVAAGTGKYVPAIATAVDGSSIPVAIVADDTVITADANAGLYLTGEFNGNALILDASYTITSITPLLRALSIFVKSSVSAADPT